MKEILNSYYKDNARKLHNVIDQIFYRKYGGTANKDMDEFYSVGNDVFTDIILNDRYDSSKGNFDGFLYGALDLAIIDEFKRQNRDKRTAKIEIEVKNGKGEIEKKKVPVLNIYMDAPIGEGENSTIGDMIQDSFDMEAALSEKMGIFREERVEKYLSSLSKVQRQIIEMKMENMSAYEIKQKLKLSDKEYNEQFSLIKSFNNIKTIRTLFGNSNRFEEKEEDAIMISTQTAEKSKPMQYSIASINKKIENRTIRFDHPLQRESDQWNPSMKGNLISDILQGNPLPEIVFAEQIINGIPVVWDLDGKQRCTNCYSFANDGFKISRNIRRWNIQYLSQIRDENGKPVLDENGFPTSEYKEFDIRGKKFSQLPSELQENFLDYTFKCDQYLNCDSEEIAYHIIRYNEGKSMSKSQKGITRIGEEFATLVKSISAMPFFREKGGYKVSEAKNGTLERVVVESVMASKYLNEWKKEQENICEYLKGNATSEDFDNFEDMVERLEKVVTDDISDMFNSKDSFLWFGLFARFIDTGEDDKRFVEFMAEFARSLHSKEVDGVTFDKLCIDAKTGNTRSTKDKYIVVPKMELLEKLMNEFLGISKSEDTEAVNTETFISKYVELPLKEVTKDIDCYEDTLNDLENNTIKDDSKLLETDNRLSLLAMVAYSFKNEVDLDNWMAEFASRNNTYFEDQKKNFFYMKSDFEEYIKKGKVA